MTITETRTLMVIKRRGVEQRTGLSRSVIYALMAEDRFPKPIKLSSRAVGWISEEVDAWIQSRIAAREAA